MNKKNHIFYFMIMHIKKHFKIIVNFCIIIFIFSLISYLYSLPLEAIFYCCILSIFVTILFWLYSFFKYYNHHKILYNLLDKITINLDGLPEAYDLIEKDYQNLLTKLYNDKVDITSQYDFKEKEMIDYYTLWVHQIKTPVSVMRLLLQSNETYENNKLSLELFKIEQYVDMVLQYLRICSESSDFVFNKYNINTIVKQAIKKYSNIFIQKKLTLNFKQKDCYIITDEKWLSFAIEQILSNSLKYTNTGSISIYIDDSKDSIITFVIEDTGIGIQQEDIQRIFDKGFTGYNGRMDKKSTGIGLYLCKKILNKLSHKITITSKVSVGTKVKIDFIINNIL